jgi:formate dehydrogenase
MGQIGQRIALRSGQLGGCAGGTRSRRRPTTRGAPCPTHALTPHVSGTTLEAQQRYASGVQGSINRFLNGQNLQREHIVVSGDQG